MKINGLNGSNNLLNSNLDTHCLAKQVRIETYPNPFMSNKDSQTSCCVFNLCRKFTPLINPQCIKK